MTAENDRLKTYHSQGSDAGRQLGGRVKNRLYCPECGAKVDGQACSFCEALDGGLDG